MAASPAGSSSEASFRACARPASDRLLSAPSASCSAWRTSTTVVLPQDTISQLVTSSTAMTDPMTSASGVYKGRRRSPRWSFFRSGTSALLLATPGLIPRFTLLVHHMVLAVYDIFATAGARPGARPVAALPCAWHLAPFHGFLDLPFRPPDAHRQHQRPDHEHAERGEEEDRPQEGRGHQHEHRHDGKQYARHDAGPVAGAASRAAATRAANLDSVVLHVAPVALAYVHFGSSGGPVQGRSY